MSITEWFDSFSSAKHPLPRSDMAATSLENKRLFQALGGAKKRAAKKPLGAKTAKNKTPPKQQIKQNKLALALNIKPTAARSTRPKSNKHTHTVPSVSFKVKKPAAAKKANASLNISFKHVSQIPFLRISNLPIEASLSDIEYIMARFGDVAHTVVQRTPKTKAATAELFYMDETSLAKAQVGMQNVISDGRKLSVSIQAQSAIVRDEREWNAILRVVRDKRSQQKSE